MSEDKIKYKRTSKVLSPCQKLDIPPCKLRFPESWTFLHATSHYGKRYSKNHNVRRIHDRPHQQQLWTTECYHSGRPIVPLTKLQLPQLEDQPFPQTMSVVLAPAITLCLYLDLS